MRRALLGANGPTGTFSNEDAAEVSQFRNDACFTHKLGPKCVYPLISRTRFDVAPNLAIADQLRPARFHATLRHAPISKSKCFYPLILNEQ